MNRWLNLILFLTLAVTCGQAAFAADNFQTTASGLKFQELKIGDGPDAEPGQVATIHFTGWVAEQGQPGKTLYNSRKEKNPFSFVIGTDKVMPAWNEGVVGMKVGGTRMLRVPPHLAYGDRAVEDVIPANASLLFVIELIELE